MQESSLCLSDYHVHYSILLLQKHCKQQATRQFMFYCGHNQGIEIIVLRKMVRGILRNNFVCQKGYVIAIIGFR